MRTYLKPFHNFFVLRNFLHYHIISMLLYFFVIVRFPSLHSCTFLFFYSLIYSFCACTFLSLQRERAMVELNQKREILPELLSRCTLVLCGNHGFAPSGNCAGLPTTTSRHLNTACISESVWCASLDAKRCVTSRHTISTVEWYVCGHVFFVRTFFLMNPLRLLPCSYAILMYHVMQRIFLYICTPF